MLFTRCRDTLRSTVIHLRAAYLRAIWGFHIHPSAQISFKAYLDRTHPQGVFIGAETIITRGATILSHDFSRARHACTIIGRRCFIGVNAIVMPGVTIGDEVVIGAGAVVTKDIPSHSLAAGNPACIRRAIRTTRYGQIVPAGLQETETNKTEAP
jgi:acetyltransferase-like isoleucine patch superfamily enzyme